MESIKNNKYFTVYKNKINNKNNNHNLNFIILNNRILI